VKGYARILLQKLLHVRGFVSREIIEDDMDLLPGRAQSNNFFQKRDEVLTCAARGGLSMNTARSGIKCCSSPKCHPAAKMGLVHRLGVGLGNSFRLGIGSSVTADENEMTAKSGMSGFRAHFSRRSSSVLTRDVGSSSSGSTIVAMMQTTQPWHRNHLVTDAGSSPRFTTRRCSLF
jgi:hypothetical protein